MNPKKKEKPYIKIRLQNFETRFFFYLFTSPTKTVTVVTGGRGLKGGGGCYRFSFTVNLADDDDDDDDDEHVLSGNDKSGKRGIFFIYFFFMLFRLFPPLYFSFSFPSTTFSA